MILSQAGNVEVMKALAALGANVNLPNKCPMCTRNARELSTQSKSQVRHLPAEMETQFTSWAIYEYVDGGETSDGTVCHVHNFSPLVVSDTTMRTLLEEVGVITHHTKKTHQHFPTKVPIPKCPQARRDSEVPTYLSVPGGEASPRQAVDIVKRSQDDIAGRQRRGVRVLCLDGGGVRGLIQLEILRQIEGKLGGRIIDKFDYIVGTSAGGITALALVYGKYIHIHVYPYVLV